MRSERVDAVHDAPAWRDRSNFVIGAPLADEGRSEQLWARQTGHRQFELCCIPFFLYDVALGDVVETDDNYDFLRVIEPSGRFVFRVWFGEGFRPRHDVASELTELGALVEWSSANLLAIDAEDEAHARTLAGYLEEQERAGRFVYETGRR
jgi:hypothetical protein